jgi:serine/threonine protein kinase
MSSRGWDEEDTIPVPFVESGPLRESFTPGGSGYLGRYRIIRLLITGGMAAIYQTHDTVLNREVALKLLDPRLAHDQVHVERFRLEARRVASLQHPHIVPLLDYGEQAGRLFLVMPFYPIALRELLQQRRVLHAAEAVGLAVQLASALDYAHQHGIIHRDVKPENVLLDDRGNALLTDFGIARAAPTAPVSLATAAPVRAAEAGRRTIATLEYSSPEHLLGRPTDARSDIYALGVVVYEMLTGRVPFTMEGDELYTSVVRLLTEHPAPPSTVAPYPLPPRMDEAVLRALANEPAHRFATAGAFAAALAEAVAAESRPPAAPRPAQREPETVRLRAQPPLRPHWPERS